MFSFHKPRVYRSTDGCCICRAKSSSSRFTDSRKYEQDSMKCFDLKYPRHGEICNACVLLVKRFKRLPIGSTRHWGHVVDARAGPGTKSITKHKKIRDDSENMSSSSATTGPNVRRTQNSKSLITEKFSKIFKKNKKSKIITSSGVEKKSGGVCKRSPASWDEQNMLASTHDSMESDYEDASGEGNDKRNINNNSTSVQFQTQTRASAYRASRKGTDSGNSSHLVFRKSPLKTGSKRRKCMPPMRNRAALKMNNDKVQFFDLTEWQERKTCCGIMYVCPSLADTILLDSGKFQVCSEHKRAKNLQTENSPTVPQEEQQSIPQKTIIATLPAVVQLSAAPSVAVVCPPPLANPVNVVKSNTTPVLKKHHLFFKRQSERFPQADLAMSNSIMNTSNKTEALVTPASNPVLNKNNTTTYSSSISHMSAKSNASFSSTIISTPLPLSINTANISAISSISSPSATSVSAAQMPRHSTAKVTTISPPLPVTVTATAGNAFVGGNRVLHKIKTGKILKNSLEKVSIMPSAGIVTTAAIERIKATDLQEIKPVMRNVPKSYVLTKPTTSGLNHPGQQIAQYYSAGSSPTSTCSNSSLISSSSATAAPKFSDNSSDSGFDENLQERKSASPLQEDTEKKLATRAVISNVHTMFLSSGDPKVVQSQNMMLGKSDITPKSLQNRKQQMTVMPANNSGTMQQLYQQQANTSAARLGSVATASLRISPVINPISVGNSAGSSSSNLGSQNKTATPPTTSSSSSSSRAIYNNNTIQHENGVTTIVPASSLAASSQTAAMNALAPSTVTITPAPTHHNLGNGRGTGAALSLTKKLTTSGVGVNLITTGGNNQSNILHTVANHTSAHLINHNSALLQQQQHLHQQQLHLQHHHSTTSNLNQKIILLKTAGGASKYNNLANINSGSSSNNIKITNVSTPITASPPNTGISKN
uniref:Protein FAM60A n=2 Tax=Ceratitis capitata TaxID=7213 RepID=W8B4U7_CERCA